MRCLWTQTQNAVTKPIPFAEAEFKRRFDDERAKSKLDLKDYFIK
jgi:hypothetical protein